MNIVFLTQESNFILKPFAWIMGIIINAIYEFIGFFGIHNIALTIFVFTFVVKMLMLPLTVKQQKTARLTSRMSPELTKIQEKYKGKKDSDSIRRMQEEQKAVYEKYGTSQFGGCLPLLISLPIMFALYRVIYAIPAYVGSIGDLYGQIATAVYSVENHAEVITNFVGEGATYTSLLGNLTKYAADSTEYMNTLIDIFVKFTPENWSEFFKLSEFSGFATQLTPVVEEIVSVNSLFGLSVLDTPSFNSISMIIPILSAGSQFIQGKLQMVQNNNKNTENPAANASKTMLYIMPLMSGWFCFMLPIGVGIYWIASAIVTIFQTIFINKYLDKTDIEAMIEKNVEKANKKKAKLGVDYGNKMAEVAKTSTKSYDTEYDKTSYKKNNKHKASGADYKRSDVSYSASSIAANANLLAARNSTDSKKNDKVSEHVESDASTAQEDKE